MVTGAGARLGQAGYAGDLAGAVEEVVGGVVGHGDRRGPDRGRDGHGVIGAGVVEGDGVKVVERLRVAVPVVAAVHIPSGAVAAAPNQVAGAAGDVHVDMTGRPAAVHQREDVAGVRQHRRVKGLARFGVVVDQAIRAAGLVSGLVVIKMVAFWGSRLPPTFSRSLMPLPGGSRGVQLERAVALLGSERLFVKVSVPAALVPPGTM